MQDAYDVVIIGGGLIGLSTALALAASDKTIALIDKNPLEARPNLRVFAINQASRTLWEQFGVWDLIKEADKPSYLHMHVWDSAQKSAIDFDARLIASSELGFILSESVIKEALLQKIATFSNISCFPLETVTKIETLPQILVEAESGQWRGKYLIIADGADSKARSVLNIPITSWPYHQAALVAKVETEKPHQRTAWQVFNPDGPLAFLPLADKHQCSIVWSTSTKAASQLANSTAEVFNEQLTKAFDNTLGEVRLISERAHFPLIMQNAKQYAGDNWMLVGDAAHSIHPLAGLGLNLGLADVRACLQAEPFSKKSLAKYQRARKHAVWQTILLLEALKAVFANPLPPIALLRAFGLNLCDKLPPLKRLMIAHANGL